MDCCAAGDAIVLNLASVADLRKACRFEHHPMDKTFDVTALGEGMLKFKQLHPGQLGYLQITRALR